MKTHILKCWPEHFQNCRSGVKKFEIRLNDREYEVGDYLEQHEFESNGQVFTGEQDTYKVTHLLKGGQFGIEPGFVVMSIE